MSLVVDTVVKKLADLATSQPSQRLIIGVTGPQGSGKTTAAQETAKQLRNLHNISAIALSLDDFYLPHDELVTIANQGNPLLQHRGLPGTHDTKLLLQFCQDFLGDSASEIRVPLYDKSLHNGAGDRSSYTLIPQGTQMILLEGWMLGFLPVGEATIKEKVSSVSNHTVKPTLSNLMDVDSKLSTYVPIWKLVSEWVRLIPQNIQDIYVWRKSQEHAMIKVKGAGMTDAQVTAFVDQYMPCYEIYMDTLRKLPAKSMAFQIDLDHQARQIS